MSESPRCGLRGCDSVRRTGFFPYGDPIRSDIQRRGAYFADTLDGVAGIIQDRLGLADWGANARQWTKARYERPRHRSLPFDRSP